MDEQHQTCFEYNGLFSESSQGAFRWQDAVGHLGRRFGVLQRGRIQEAALQRYNG